MEGWVGQVGWPIADTLPTKRSHVNSAKVHQPKTDVLTTDPRRQPVVLELELQGKEFFYI